MISKIKKQKKKIKQKHQRSAETICKVQKYSKYKLSAINNRSIKVYKINATNRGYVGADVHSRSTQQQQQENIINK